MKLEIERAMREVLEAWETRDIPEALASAIYQMKRVYMAQVITDIKKPKRISVGWKCTKCGKYFRKYGMEASQHQMLCQPEIYKP